MIPRGVLLVGVLTTIAACGRQGVARGAATDADSLAPRMSSPVVEVIYFRPEADPIAAPLWKRAAAQSGGEAARGELVERYERLGFRTMAKFVRASGKVRSGGDPKARIDALLQPTGRTWTCTDFDIDKVYAELAEIDRHIARDDFAAAQRAGEEATRTYGPACPLLIEMAVATLSADAFGGPVADEAFEIAFRTVMTADVDMGFPWHGGAREWPYQLATLSFLVRGDAESAVIASEIALARFYERRADGRGGTAAAEAQLRELARRARAAL